MQLAVPDLTNLSMPFNRVATCSLISVINSDIFNYFTKRMKCHNTTDSEAA